MIVVAGSGEAVVYIVKDPSAGWGEGLLLGSLVGDRPSVGTVRRGWFPSKHTTCKRQLPDTRPHQAIVTVSSSSLHLPFPPVSPISSDPSAGSRAAVCTAQPSPPLFLSSSARCFTKRAFIRKDPVYVSTRPFLLSFNSASRSRREREEIHLLVLPSLPPFSILADPEEGTATRATSSYRDFVLVVPSHRRIVSSSSARTGSTVRSVLGTSPASSRSQSH